MSSSHTFADKSTFSIWKASVYSGIVQSLIGHPFDTWKTQRQLAMTVSSSTQTHNIIQIAKNAYRGYGAAAPPFVALNSISFFMQSALLQQWNRFQGSQTPQTNGFHIVPSIANGLITGCFMAPFDYLKIIRQSQNRHSIHPIRLSRVFQAGGNLCVLRETVCVPLYFYLFHQLHEIHEWYPSLTGAIAGLSTWTLSFSLDMYKSQKTLYPTLTPWGFIRFTYVRGGKQLLRPFYRGFLPCAIRAVIVNGAAFSIFTKIMENTS